MSKRVFYALTGRPGCGKTTAILKIVEKLREAGVEVEGMYTTEIRVSGRRVGFSIRRISGGEGTLAHIRFKDGPRLGKYIVNLSDLERIGVSAIIEGMEKADLLVVDEVGPMELFSERFREAVSNLLSSDKHAILTVHYRSKDPLVSRIKRAAGRNLIVLDERNRDEVPDLIVKDVLTVLGRMG